MLYLAAFVLAVPAVAESGQLRATSPLFVHRSASGSDASMPPLKQVHPHYHTSSEIDQEVHRLAGSCEGMEVSQEQQDGVAITVVKLHATNATSAVNRVFMLFGEHARELISPESGLMMLRQLCGDAPMQEGQDRAAVLAKNEFLFVLNANPRSRLLVEQGDFCVRTNPSAVDLNRNWGDRWTWKAPNYRGTAGSGSGSAPFSEPETKILKRLVEAFQPTTFLSIHSGTRGMYMPWSYDMEHLADRNRLEMLAVLEQVDARHCRCPFGAAGRELQYSAPGTSVDWVYDKLQTPYVFTYEIYTGRSPKMGTDDKWTHRFEEEINGAGVAGESLLQLAFDEVSDADVEKSERGNPRKCFWLFNPNTRKRYDETVTNWVAAFVETLTLIAQNLERSGGNVISVHDHD